MAQANPRGRTIEERAGLRWPSLLPRLTRLMLRLRPGSRARRAMLRRMAEMAFAGWHRGDFALVPYVDDPEVETHVAKGSAPPIGLDPVYYGPEGHCRAMEVWNEAWAEWNAEIVDVIEEGRDRVLVIGRIHAVGATSGLSLDEWGAVRYTFREGRIVRVDGIFDPDLEQLERPRQDSNLRHPA
jgi:ketosteroid isomerase-like protein